VPYQALQWIPEARASAWQIKAMDRSGAYDYLKVMYMLETNEDLSTRARCLMSKV